jgi:4-amino-4-deoxy-L-arabinose transferase-like glycosyltransferase
VLKTGVVVGAVLVLQVLYYAAPIGRTEFFRKGEAREALVVTAMFTQHEWVLPRRNGADVPSKPPLFHWMGAGLSVLGGGPSEETIRLPSALCAAGAGTLVLLRLAGSAGLGTALLAVLMLAAMPVWESNAGAARVDMCFAAAVTASVLALERVCRDAAAGRGGTAWPLAAVAALTASILAKGPAGLVLPVVIVVGAVALGRDHGGLRAVARPVLGPLAGVMAGATLLAGVWYLLAYREGGMEFVRVQLLRENFARLVPTQGLDPGHHRPVYYGVVFLVTAAAPWCLLYPLAAVTARRRAGDEATGCGAESRGSRELVVLCLWWIAVFTAAVSVSGSKREAYLLPVMPAIVMVLALAVAGVTTSMRRGWAVRLVALGAILAGGLLCLGMLVAVGALAGAALGAEPLRALAGSSRLVGAARIVMSTPALLLVLAGAALAFAGGGRCWWQGRARPGAVGLALGMIILTTAAELVLEPPFARAHAASPFAEELQPLLGEEPVFQWKCELYALAYYLHRDVPCLRPRDVPPPPYLVLVPTGELSRFRRRHPTATFLRESVQPAANGRDRVTLVRVPAAAARPARQ